MVRNSAHDSVCACSVDDVVDAVLHRYAEARHIGEGLTETVLDVGGPIDGAPPGRWPSTPSARDRAGMVEVVVTAVGRTRPRRAGPVGADRLPGSITLDGETVRNMLGLIQGARIDADSFVTDVALAEDEEGLEVTVVIGAEEREGVPVEEVKRELYTRLTARPGHPGPTDPRPAPVRRILARQRGARVRLGPLRGRQRARPSGDGVRRHERPRRRGLRRRGLRRRPRTSITLTNGLVTVVIDAGDRGDGTFSVDGVPATGGWSTAATTGTPTTTHPPPATRWSTRPETVAVCVVERGTGPGRRHRHRHLSDGPTGSTPTPGRGSARHHGRGGDQPRAPGRRAGGPGAHPFVNPSRDHRLRVHLPLREPADDVDGPSAPSPWSSGAWWPRGVPEEFGTPTFPSRRFVSSGGLTVVHDGLLEYELVDIERRCRRRHRHPGDGQGPAPWPSPSCGRPGCCPGWG